MNQYNRYFLVLFEENPFTFKFFKPAKNVKFSKFLDLDLVIPIIQKNERISIPLLTEGKYSLLGIIDNNTYFSSKSNLLMSYLQENKLIYSSNIMKSEIFTDSFVPTLLEKGLAEPYPKINSYLNHKFEQKFKPEFLSMSKNTNISDLNFTQHDFQPLLFAHDVYLRVPQVKDIFNDISDLYSFVIDNFNSFIKNSSINEDFKDIHYLDINYALYEHFTDIKDVIVLNDYIQLLNNSYSYKYQTKFMKSMLDNKSQTEINKIKNFLIRKESENSLHTLSVLLGGLDRTNREKFNDKKQEYIETLKEYFGNTIKYYH